MNATTRRPARLSAAIALVTALAACGHRAEKALVDQILALRSQLRAGGKPVEVGALAAPGVTGDKVPGFTKTAPTRPAPFSSPRSILTSTELKPSQEMAAQQGLQPPHPLAPAPQDTSTSVRPDTTRSRNDSVTARVNP